MDTIENPNVETHLPGLREWTERLPHANPPKVAGMVFEALYRLNRFPAEIPHYPELLACYQSSFNTLFESARNTGEKRGSQATGQRQRELDSMLLKITTELAYGYKRVINENLRHDSRLRGDQHLGTAVFFAIKALTLELMFEYAGFMPHSKSAWRELIKLYTLAELHTLSHQPVENGVTIDLLFKHILLIVLIDPYRLQHGEVWSCHDYIGRWSAKAELGQATALPEKVGGYFLIDLQGMQPPKPLEPDMALLPEQQRLLHVAPLSQWVHKQFQQLRDNPGHIPEGTQGLSAFQTEQMFRHMLLAWHVRPRRRSPRKEKYGWHLAACGLSAINHFLHQGWLTHGRQEASADPEDDLALTLEASPPPQGSSPHYKEQRWRLFDESSNGVGAIVNAPFPGDLQVGQLVLLAADNGQNHIRWPIGVVRRMIERDANTLEIGIQFIRGMPSPAGIRPHMFGTEPTTDFQPGLLLERDKNAPRLLLAPHGTYLPGRELVLDHDGEIFRILAGRQIESSPAFDRFEYQEIERQ